MAVATMKYLVIINWHGEVHKIWTTSGSDDKALNNACERLAKKLGVNSGSVRVHVLDGKDRWKIDKRISNERR